MSQDLRPKGVDVGREELGDMVDKEMASTSAAIEEAVRRIDVSLKHAYLARFWTSLARLFLPECLINLLLITSLTFEWMVFYGQTCAIRLYHMVLYFNFFKLWLKWCFAGCLGFFFMSPAKKVCMCVCVVGGLYRNRPVHLTVHAFCKRNSS